MDNRTIAIIVVLVIVAAVAINGIFKPINQENTSMQGNVQSATPNPYPDSSSGSQGSGGGSNFNPFSGQSSNQK